MNDDTFSDLQPSDHLIRAVVAAACTRTDTTGGGKWWAHTPLDWSDVATRVAVLEIGPIMYRGLRCLSSAGPSKTLLDAFGAKGNRLFEQALYRMYVDAVRRNTALYDQLAHVVQEATRCKLKIIVLKGAYLATYVYDEPGLRSMSDIDVLVSRDDLDAAERMMHRLGYQYLENDHSPDVWRSEHFHLNPFVHPDHPVPVEVHFSLTRPDDKVCFDDEGLWARAVPRQFADASVLTLDTLDLLLHLSVHSCYLDKLKGPSLRQTCDIATVVNQVRPGIDWGELGRRASSFGADKYLYLSLELAGLVCGARVPGKFISDLHPEDLPPGLLREGTNRIFKRSYSLPISSTLAALGTQAHFKANLQRVARSFSRDALQQNYDHAGPAVLLISRRVADLIRRYGKSVVRLWLGDMETRAAMRRIAGADDWLA